MLKIYDNVLEMVGNTPLLRLNQLKKEMGYYADIYAKLESYNPGGSVKDRIAKKMLEDAKKSGEIDKNTVIIEATSGNTGIGLAMAATVLGNRIIIVMPDSMSIERRKIMKALGAEIELTKGQKGMNGAIERAKKIAKKIENSFIPSQFDNPSNPNAHRTITANEIYEVMDGNLDYFVAGVGTGGTITGVGEKLKEKCNTIKIVAVEPYNSSVLSGMEKGKHKIQGIGAGFIPQILNTDIIDIIERIKDEEAFETARQVASTEGLMIGISAGAAIKGAINIALDKKNKGKKIVVIVPDNALKYLSSDIY